jgi:uncharacterized protein YndB with AHSA1/START domain
VLRVSVDHIDVAAPPARVYEVLMDAHRYADWVIGAKRVRGVDPEWPAVGARFHHTVGVSAAEIADSSKLLAREPNRHVALEVRFRPVGVGVVTLDLTPNEQGGTHVKMTEAMRSGPLAWLWSRPLDELTSLRNRYSLRRLARIAES